MELVHCACIFRGQVREAPSTGYRIRCGFIFFHSGERIYFFPLWRADLFFRIRCRIRRIRVDGSRIRKEKVADSKISGYVWTGPKTELKSKALRWRAVWHEKRKIVIGVSKRNPVSPINQRWRMFVYYLLAPRVHFIHRGFNRARHISAARNVSGRWQ